MVHAAYGGVDIFDRLRLTSPRGEMVHAAYGGVDIFDRLRRSKMA